MHAKTGWFMWEPLYRIRILLTSPKSRFRPKAAQSFREFVHIGPSNNGGDDTNGKWLGLLNDFTPADRPKWRAWISYLSTLRVVPSFAL